MACTSRVLPCLFAITAGVPPGAHMPPQVRPAALHSGSASPQKLDFKTGMAVAPLPSVDVAAQLASTVQSNLPLQELHSLDQANLIDASRESHAVSWNKEQKIWLQSPIDRPFLGNLRLQHASPTGSPSSWPMSVGLLLLATMVGGWSWRNKRANSTEPSVATTELSALNGFTVSSGLGSSSSDTRHAKLAGRTDLSTSHVWRRKLGTFGFRQATTRCASTETPSELLTSRESDDLWPKLFQWLKGTGTDTSDFAIEAKQVDMGQGCPGELGLVAQSKLEAGDILAWAPTSILLNKAKAVEIWGDSVDQLPERTAVALLLIHERFVRGETSPWRMYLGAVPRFNGDVSGPSWLWEEDELRYLEGSDCYPASIQLFNQLVDEYKSLEDSLFQARPEDFPPEAFSDENFLWAAALVSSRAYGDDEEGSNLAIAPLVDLLNHRAGALQLTRFGNGIVAYAHIPYEPGDQVFVSYGGKTNAQMLTQYGFVDETNPYEAVFLRIATHFDLAEPLLELKMKLLEELWETPPERVFLRVARKSREWQTFLLPTLRILSLSSEDTPPTTARDLVPTQHARLEAAAFDLFVKAVDRRLQEYPSTLDEDRLLLKQGLAPRAHLAVQLRISEQELLLDVRSQADEAARSLKERETHAC